MLQDRDRGDSEVQDHTVTAHRSARLLQEQQRNEIIAAIEKPGLDPGAFDLNDDGVEVRLKHTMSVSCFTFYRDKTWRYLGTRFVGYRAEVAFDLSWRAVIPLISLWIAEVKRDCDALDV